MSGQVEFHYFHFSAPSRAVWMVLETLGLKYKECVTDLSKGQHKTDAYKKLNIRQKVPAIKDGELCLAESRAIATYLMNKYASQEQKDKLYPEDPAKRAKIDQHLYISDAVYENIMSYVDVAPVLFVPGQTTKTEKMGVVVQSLDLLEEILKDHTYSTADHVTLPDFFYLSGIGLLDVSGFDNWAKYPRITEWKKKMAALPCYEKTHNAPITELAGAYQAKIKENTK